MSGPDMSSPRAKNLALALLALTQFVVVIDASITNVALPSIGKALDISQDDLSWVVNSYTLVFGGFLLLGGRLADFFGRRRMFMVGRLDRIAMGRAGSNIPRAPCDVERKLSMPSLGTSAIRERRHEPR